MGNVGEDQCVCVNVDDGEDRIKDSVLGFFPL